MVHGRQTDQLMYTSASQIPDLESQMREQRINSTETDIDGRAHPPEIPAGGSSALLERRPDVVQADQQLIGQDALTAALPCISSPALVYQQTMQESYLSSCHRDDRADLLAGWQV
jgi:hypothetical protein